MKVEIWSDVMCPFCYIGKRKFELAMKQFVHKSNIEIEWKSFELNPNMKTLTDKSLYQYFADRKGISLEQAIAMNTQVTEMAKQVGLDYHLEKAIPANSFKAHRFSHFAKANAKQDEAEEKLFYAYFTEGKNIDDMDTLIALGQEIGLNKDELRNVLETDLYANDVRKDETEAQQLGVQGVPFFVFDRKYAVSGAQDVNTFLQTLNTSFTEWQKEHPETKLNVIEGNVCTPDGNCD